MSTPRDPLPEAASPPRLARALLSRLIPRHRGEELVVDLDDEFAERARSGRFLARVWYWRQVLRPDVLRFGAEAREMRTVRVGSHRAAGIARSLLLAPLRRDLAFAFRRVRREPGYSALVAATIALGVGATSAVFSVVDGVLLRPLPYPEPERLVYLWARTAEDATVPFSGPEMKEFIEFSSSYEVIGRAFGVVSASLALQDRSEQISTLAVSDDLFRAYGVRPLHGRDFVPEDTHFISVDAMRDPDLERPVSGIMLSYPYWMRRFGGDPDVVGRILRLDGNRREVAGVMPPGFATLLPAEVGYPTATIDAWTIPYWDQSLFPRDTRFVHMVGRLAPGVSVEAAQAEADAFVAAQRERFSTYVESEYSIRVAPLHEEVVRGSSTPVLVLFGAVSLVLLIACANVANLELAMAIRRRGEFAVRAAMGGGRGRLLRQSLTESAALGLLGAGLGVLLAYAAVRGLMAVEPGHLPRLEQVSVDGRVLVFAVVASLASAMISGLLPALRSVRTDLAGEFRAGRSSAGREGATLRRGLVVAEIGLTLVLVVGAGLLLRSFVSLYSDDLGIEPDGVLYALVGTPTRAIPDPQGRIDFLRALTQRVSDVPGVVSAGVINPVPLTGTGDATVGVQRAGAVLDLPVSMHRVLPGALETLGISLLQGRLPSWPDLGDWGQLTAVVDRHFAQLAWPDDPAVGQAVRILRREYSGDSDVRDVTYWAEVIGVVDDVAVAGPGVPAPPTVYVSYNQNPWGTAPFVARTAGGVEMLFDPVADAVASFRTDVSLSRPLALSAFVESELAPTRFSLALIAAFGALGLALALIGVYGVMSYTMDRRIPELGVRMILGAGRRDIRLLVLREGALVVAVGLLLGLLLALVGTRVLATQLFEVSPSDPLTYGLVVLLVAAAAVAACLLPAHRASSLDPLDAVRRD